MTDKTDDPPTMGIWMTSALVVGTIIGAGIFMLPVSLAPLGRNVPIGWLISGAGVMAIVFALARLARLGGEGIQANVERQFGATAGFLVAWSFWVSNWSAQASVAVGAVSALSFLDPSAFGSASIVPLAIAALIAVTGINMAGIAAAGRFGIVTVAIKLIPLLGVIWLLATSIGSGTPLVPFAPAPINFSNIAAATALTFFALTGFEAATAPVGKVRDPARTIPRALIGGTLLVVLLYLAAGTAIQRLLPAAAAAASPAPFADVLSGVWGSGGASLAAICIAVAAIGCLNGLALGTGELGLAMGRRGDLPRAMAITRGGGTPVVAQAVGALLTILLLLANSSSRTAALFTFVILLSTAAVVVVYAIGAAAAWTLTGAGGKAVIVAAIGFLAFAAYGVGLEAGGWSIALLAIGLAVRALMHRASRTAEPQAELPESTA